MAAAAAARAMHCPALLHIPALRAGALSRAYGWVRVKGLTQNIINCNNVFGALIHFFFFFFRFPSLTLSSLN